MNKLLLIGDVENRIFLIRGKKVMLDKDLAILYGVPTKRLNEQVRRNAKRFPEDFMFRLNKEDALIFQPAILGLRSQNATLKQGQHLKYLPYAFTEQGVAMLSTVLNSEKAIRVNIVIMRTFVKIRELLSTHKELADKLAELERKVEKHDAEIQGIFSAIRQLMAPPPEKPKRRIGFRQD